MCYQIPALAKTGIVLVVSPLIGGCLVSSVLDFDFFRFYILEESLTCKTFLFIGFKLEGHCS